MPTTRWIAFALATTVGGVVTAPVNAGSYPRMFVTSTSGTGDLSSWDENTTPPSGFTGVAAGDHICQERAEAAGFATAGHPTYRAWLSDTGTDAWCHVQGLTGKRFTPPQCDGGTLVDVGPWVRQDGQPFSNELSRLVVEGAIQPPQVTETGEVLDGWTAWTGTYGDGGAYASRCADWSSADSKDEAGIGLAYNSGNWSSNGPYGCNYSARLYCFEETAAGVGLPRPAVAGALAFVTQAAHMADFGGLAAADTICQTAAAAAFLPNPDSFVAWLSDSTGNAVDRVGGDGPWKTLDGYPIASSKADLTDGSIATPIRLDEYGGSRATRYYWTGSSQDGTYTGNPEDTCGDWNDLPKSDYGVGGAAGEKDSYWTTGLGARCLFIPDHLLCMSDVVLLGWDNFELGDFRRWSAVSGAP